MKPKPFVELNHLTVPIVTYFSKLRKGALSARCSCRLKFDFNDDLGNGTSYGAANKADRLLEYDRAMQLMWIYKSLPDFRRRMVDRAVPSQKVE